MAASAEEKKSANKVVTQAAKSLREAYPKEYETFKEQAAAKLGVPHKRRKTQDEKDREALSKLLNSNPTLRSELVKEIVAQSGPPVGGEATA